MSNVMQMRPLELHEYMTSEVYKTIAHRMYSEHGIRVPDHVKHMIKVEKGLGQGITFVPKDYRKLTREVMNTNAFSHDDRDYLIHRAAAAVTKGEGYREIGPLSLHIAISESRVNIHLDDYGFIGVGPDGKSYVNAELFQHIGDDLGVGFLREFFNPRWRPAGWALEHAHLTLPNAQNRYQKQIGLQVDLARGRSNDPEKRWKLSFDLNLTCNDRWCKERERFVGVNLVVGRTPADTSSSRFAPPVTRDPSSR